MSRHRWVLQALLTSLLLVGAPGQSLAGPAGEESPAGDGEPPVIRVEQGRVTVNVAGASLEEVLQEISAQSRISVILYGSRREPISAAFASVPLEEAVRQLLQSNFLLVYARDGHLAEVRVWREPEVRIVAEESESVESLIEALEKGESTHRRQAVLALGELNNAQAVDPLVKALEEDDAAEVRQAAVVALEKLEGPEAAAALADAVSDDGDQAVRLSAVKALAKRGGPEAVDALTQALEADAEPSVRHEALARLAEWGDDQARDAIQQALDDPEASIREKAAEFLQHRNPAGSEP